MEPIRIANPLYDVVFRYMMEDNRVAKLFLSAILGKEVEELRFNPTEYSRKLGDASITVIRMDFHAKIREAGGKQRVVLIELQKAKLYQQIMRFRNYLGKQYQNPENIDGQGNPLPIYPIYILGEAITEATIPVIRVSRGYIDAATEERIEERHPFIEALTHDATVIQAEHIKGRRRTVLEQFLSIFDQSARTDAKGHILALNEDNYPEPYRPVIRRLQKALLDPQLEEDMNIEDEVLSEFHKKDEQIAAAVQLAEEALQREETERSAKNTLIRQLAAMGMAVAQIAAIAHMGEAAVQEVLDEA